MTIQFVVPERREGGVYDFSTLLAGALRDRGEEVELVHLDASSALSWRPSEHVVVQYSGYGFAKRGAPVWLLATLAAKRRQIRRLGVFFHELYAEGPPTTSAFWLSPAQKGVARGLAELCDFWMTSREGSAAWLRRYAASKPHAVMPVFSTIGETANLPDELERSLVVFGGPGLRHATYIAAGDQLWAFAEREQLRIHDVGAPFDDLQLHERLRRSGATLHGASSAASVRALLARAECGLLGYPASYAAKSSVLAAYAAHRVCPIMFSRELGPHDGLTASSNYWAGLSGTGPNAQERSRIGWAAREWYVRHSLTEHRNAIEHFMQSRASNTQPRDAAPTKSLLGDGSNG